MWMLLSRMVKFSSSSLVVITADTKAVTRVDLEVIHFLVKSFAWQIIHFVLVRWIGTPVTAGGECLTDDEASGRQIRLRSQGQDLVEMTLEVGRTPAATGYLCRSDEVGFDLQIAGGTGQGDLHCTFGLEW